MNRTGAEEVPEVNSDSDDGNDDLAGALPSLSIQDERLSGDEADYPSSVTVSEPSSPPTKKLKGKKAKDARKAARIEQQQQQQDRGGDYGIANDVDFVCQVCKNQFDTRNKLFTHINKTGHAALKVLHILKKKKNCA